MHHVSGQQIMFEDYQFEGIAIGIQPILSLYARGQLSSVSQFSDICKYLCTILRGYLFGPKSCLETACALCVNIRRDNTRVLEDEKFGLTV